MKDSTREICKSPQYVQEKPIKFFFLQQKKTEIFSIYTYSSKYFQS